MGKITIFQDINDFKSDLWSLFKEKVGIKTKKTHILLELKNDYSTEKAKALDELLNTIWEHFVDMGDTIKAILFGEKK